MPFVGITPPAGGLPPERRVERDKRIKRVQRVDGVEREVDEAELSSVERAHRDEPVQEAATEEGRDDRQAHNAAPTYTPDATKPAKRRPRIDLEG